MKEYKIIESMELFSGKIGLTEKQAGPRSASLVPEEGKPGIYTITGQIVFKAGEIIRIDPDKATLAKIELTPAGLAELEREEKSKEAEKFDAWKKQEAEAKAKADAEAMEALKNELTELKAKKKPIEADIDRMAEIETMLKDKSE